MGFFSKKSRSVSESGHSKPKSTKPTPPLPKHFNNNNSVISLNSPTSIPSPQFTKLDLSAPSSNEGWSTINDDSPAPGSPYSAAAPHSASASTSRLAPSVSSRFPNPFRTVPSASSSTGHVGEGRGAYKSQVPLSPALGDLSGPFTPQPASASGTTSSTTTSQRPSPLATAPHRPNPTLPSFSFDSSASASSVHLAQTSTSSWEEIAIPAVAQSPPAIDTSDLALAPPNRLAIFAPLGSASSLAAGSTISLASTLTSPDTACSPVERENTPPLGTQSSAGVEKEKRSRWKLVGRSAGAPKKRNSLGAMQLLGSGMGAKAEGGGFEVTNFRSVARVTEDDPTAAGPPSSRTWRDDRSSQSAEPDRTMTEPELMLPPPVKVRQESSPAVLPSSTSIQRPSLSPQQQPKSSFRGSEPERAPSPTISADTFRRTAQRTRSSLSLGSNQSFAAEIARDASSPPQSSARFQPDRRAAVRRGSQGSMTIEQPASLGSHGRRASQLWDNGSPGLIPPKLPFVKNSDHNASSSSLGSYGTADEGDGEAAEELSPEAISRPTSAMGGRPLRQMSRDSSSEAELRILSMYARTDSRPSTAYTEDTPRPMSRSSINSPDGLSPVSPKSVVSVESYSAFGAIASSTSPTLSNRSSSQLKTLVPPPQPGAPAGMAKGAGKGAAPLLAFQPPTPISAHDFTPHAKPSPSPSKPAAHSARPAQEDDESDSSDSDDEVPLGMLRNASHTSLHLLARAVSPKPSSPAMDRQFSNEIEVLSEPNRPFFAEPVTDSPPPMRTAFGKAASPTEVDSGTGRAFPRQGNERRSVSTLALPAAKMPSSPSSPNSISSFGPAVGHAATYLSTPASSTPPSPMNRSFGRSSSAGQLSGILAKPIGATMAAGSTSSSSGGSDPSSSMPRTPKDMSPVPSSLGGKLPALNGSSVSVNKVPSSERLGVSFSVPPSPGRDDSSDRKWQARRVGQPLSGGGSTVTSRGRPVPRTAKTAPVPSNAAFSARSATPSTPGSSYDRMKARHRAETREALQLGRDLNGSPQETDEDDDAPLASLPTRFGGSVAGGSVVGGFGGSHVGSTISGMGGMTPSGVNPMMMMQHQPVAAGGYAQMAYPPPGVDPYLYASLPNDQKLSLHQRSAQMMGMMQQAALSARAESMVSGQWDDGSQVGVQGGGAHQRPGSAMGSHGVARAGGGMPRPSSVQSMASMGGMGGMPMHPLMMNMGMGSHQSMINLAQFGAMPSPASPMGSMGGRMGAYGMPPQHHQHQQFLPSFAPHFGAAPWAMGGMGAGSMMGLPTGGYAGSDVGGGMGRTSGARASRAGMGGGVRASASTIGFGGR